MERPTRQDTNPAPDGSPSDQAEATAGSGSMLRRAFQLLDSFSAERPTLSVRELARRSGVPRSTVHRLVTELVAWGALERTSQGVRPGVKLFELGTLAPNHSRLRDAAPPFAHHLHEVSGLTVNIAVREGHEVVYVEKITTRSLRVPHSRLGGRVPLHATALGKAILAFSDTELVNAVLETGLLAMTPKTLTDPPALRRELTTVRRDKVAYDVEESQLGLFCVASPVLRPPQGVIGAVSVTGATEHSQAERYAPAVRTTAMAVARALQPQRIPR